MPKDIYITSFKKADRLPDGVMKFSAAVYQPQDCNYPKAEWCDIRDDTGQWIRPNRYLDEPEPLAAYRQVLLMHYEARHRDIRTWINHIGAAAALLCWCPYERAAQRQLQEFGSFVCHTAVLAEVLSSSYRTRVNVFLDSDRLRMTTLTQKGF